MKNIRTLSRKFGAKVAAANLAILSVAAHAQATPAADGITAALDAVDLGGIVVKVIACGLLIVAIALAFKGPQIAKRVVSRV